MAQDLNTFSESWHRVANQRIHLRSNVRVRRQHYRGERWYVLENPLNNQYFRLRPEAYEFIARLRPDQTVEQVWHASLKVIQSIPLVRMRSFACSHSFTSRGCSITKSLRIVPNYSAALKNGVSENLNPSFST